MMAGLTVMNEMKPDVYERMNKMGKSMRDGLKRILQEEKISAYVGGIGSFFWISWTDVDVYDHATSLTSDRVLFNYFNIGMMNEGCFILGHPNVSAIQTKEDIKTGLKAAKKTIANIKPIIKRRKPSILD
jgi:glutamate-1-semialdehyde aminotransferase